MKKYIVPFVICVGCSLVGCATPPIATFETAPGGGLKGMIVGSGSFMEDTNAEKQNHVFQINPVTGMIEIRLREEKYQKRQTTVPNNYVNGKVLLGVAEEGTKAAAVTADRDVKLGSQATDRFKAANTPAIQTPETTPVWGPSAGTAP